MQAPPSDRTPDVHFSCVECGRCCHDLKLTLSLEETSAWLERGGSVEILCEAIPWPQAPPSDDAYKAYRSDVSFAAHSGDLPVRISAIFAASFPGPCPNLGTDMLCTIYEDRPSVCRIYPANFNPFVTFSIDSKSCPSNAWDVNHPLYIQDDAVVGSETSARIRKLRSDIRSDASRKSSICALLGINSASLANEGYVVHAPPSELLALAIAQEREDDSTPPWSIVSNRAPTINAIIDAGGTALPAAQAVSTISSYIAFFPEVVPT